MSLNYVMALRLENVEYQALCVFIMCFVPKDISINIRSVRAINSSLYNCSLLFVYTTYNLNLHPVAAQNNKMPFLIN